MPMQNERRSLNLLKYRQTIGYVNLMTHVPGVASITEIRFGRLAVPKLMLTGV
jgi:hypothetical protein